MEFGEDHSSFGEHEAESTSNPKHRAIFDNRSLGSGTSRNAYKGKVIQPISEILHRKRIEEEIVAKTFKSKYAHHRSDWNLDIKTAKKADELARTFNGVSGSEIHFSEVIPMKVTRRIPGRIESSDISPINSQLATALMNVRVGEWVVAEPYLRGKYTKWLSNDGWVNNSEHGPSLPAFSHWTWVETGGEVLVCDLQGVCDNDGIVDVDQVIQNIDKHLPTDPAYWLTDPAIHSPGQEYGNTDLGNMGILKFFATHECNAICKHLNIDKKKPRQDILRPAGLTPQRNSSYTDAGIKEKNQHIPKLSVIEE